MVKKAAEETKNKKIGILSTKATAQSSYQRTLIEKFAADCFFINIGTDRLVPLIERGEVDGSIITSILQQELQPFIKHGVDTLALGCSHFPFLRNSIQTILGKGVSILDSGGAIARQVKRVLTNNNALADSDSAFHTFYTTGEIHRFQTLVDKLLGKNFAKIERANL